MRLVVLGEVRLVKDDAAKKVLTVHKSTNAAVRSFLQPLERAGGHHEYDALDAILLEHVVELVRSLLGVLDEDDLVRTVELALALGLPLLGHRLIRHDDQDGVAVVVKASRLVGHVADGGRQRHNQGRQRLAAARCVRQDGALAFQGACKHHICVIALQRPQCLFRLRELGRLVSAGRVGCASSGGWCPRAREVGVRRTRELGRLVSAGRIRLLGLGRRSAMTRSHAGRDRRASRKRRGDAKGLRRRRGVLLRLLRAHRRDQRPPHQHHHEADLDHGRPGPRLQLTSSCVGVFRELAPGPEVLPFQTARTQCTGTYL
jgi:hypothetical protein